MGLDKDKMEMLETLGSSIDRLIKVSDMMDDDYDIKLIEAYNNQILSITKGMCKTFDRITNENKIEWDARQQVIAREIENANARI